MGWKKMLITLDKKQLDKFLEYPCLTVYQRGIEYMIYVDNSKLIQSVKRTNQGYGKPIKTTIGLEIYPYNPYNGGFMKWIIFYIY